MRKTQPTKDLDIAVARLMRAADANGLMAFGSFAYDGSIRADLTTAWPETAFLPFWMPLPSLPSPEGVE